MKFPIICSCALIVASASAACAETTAEAWSYTGTDIFPSAIIATATVDWHAGEEDEPKAKQKKGEPKEVPMLGDKNGWIGARILEVPKGAEIKVEVVGEGWLKTSKVTVKVPEAEEEVLVLPKGIFDYEALHGVTQQKPANLSVKISVNGKELPEQTEVVTLRSINECPFAVIFGEGDEATTDPLDWMFAAYVNENHPWIDGILKEALEAKLVDSFDGYQSGDPEKVMAEVFAIWQILQRHGMKYSDITNTPKSKFALAQTVRFLDQSIKGSQANCVDGSVIFASILTKISLKCGLVLVPGHCYLCFDLNPEGTLDMSAEEGECTVLGLETTMLGQDDLKPLQELKHLPAKVRAKVAKAESAASGVTFANAISSSTEALYEHAAEFDEEDSEYHIIPISEAREFGIMPIASGEKK